MANFSVRVCKVEKKAQHPNADRLTIYNVSGYNCISNKLPNGEDRYNVGDLVVYIPEQSVLPKWLLQKMELWNDEKDCGVLGGSKGDRVVTIKLRGIPSTGLLYPITNGKMDYMGLVDDDELEPLSIDVDEGDNVIEHLGITKYEPPIPASMGGEIFSGGTSIVESYDVEPIEKYKHLLVDGELVVIQEKLHGCADYDTIIDSLKHGKIKIGEYVLKNYEGDMVKSYNTDTKEVEYRPIVGHLIQENNDDWYEITTDDGIVVKLTGDHRVWCENLKAYRCVRDLDGSEIVLIDD